MTPTQMRTGRKVEKSESRNVFLLILLRASKKRKFIFRRKKSIQPHSTNDVSTWLRIFFNPTGIFVQSSIVPSSPIFFHVPGSNE